MSVALLKNNAVLMLKTEVTYGVDSVPTPGANAIQVRNVDIQPVEGSAVDLAYVVPWYGQSQALRVTNYMTASFEVDWCPGAQAAGAIGPLDPLEKACGLSSSAIAAAVTGTAQAGGSTTSIKLAAAASAVDNVYRGMTLTITGGTAAGQVSNVVAYNGTSKVATLFPAITGVPDATSTYSLAPAVFYDPVAAGFGSMTLYYNVAGVLHKMVGARGTLSWELSANALPTLKASLTGLYGGIVDQAIAGVVYPAVNLPPAVNSANTTGGLFDKPFTGGVPGIQVQKFSLDLGNTVTYRNLVGSEAVIIPDRKAKGSISFEMTTLAFQDWLAAVRNGTTGALNIQNGTVAGNRIRADLPKVQLDNLKYSESDGIVMADVDFRPIWTAGNDDLRITEK